MNVDIRLPHINSETAAGQLQQIKSYLYQLASQLQWALDTVGTEEDRALGSVNTVQSGAASSQTGEPVTPQSTFESIKALIIKSAEIVSAYYETINTKLYGEYSALSEFGAFKESTEASIEGNSKDIIASFQKIEELEGEIKATNGYIKTGELYEDETGTKYGIEIGQTFTDETTGTDTFYKFARFTADMLAFYDLGASADDPPMAWFSQQKLYVNSVQINSALKLNGYLLETKTGLAFKWVGV